MTPIYIIIEPFNPTTGLRETVRLGSAASSAAMGLDGFAWTPAVAQRPVFSIELMSPDLDGRVQAGQCNFAINLNAFANGAAMAAWKWLGAPITLYSAPDLALPSAPDFAGRIATPTLDRENLVLSVQASVDTTFLDKPLLTAELDGSGDMGGEAEARGTLKPAGFGACENIPPVWFDKTNWIGMIDGYGNTTAITRLMEGLNDFGARVADYADYAALKAAIVAKAIPPGRWGTCVAQGLVGLGAPPTGPITVNATFGSNRLGAISQRILTTHALVPAGNVDAAAFAALDAAVNRAAHYWTSEQREVRNLLEAMAASVNATPLVTGQNKVTITRAVASAAVATLDRSGSTLPRVTDWRSTSARAPVWRLTARVARPASIVDLKDVNYVDDIIDRGAWAVGTVYRAGNLVWARDKSSWIYINAEPGAGHVLPSSIVGLDAYWQMISHPLTAPDLRYANGDTVESLKPAEPGARTIQTVRYPAPPNPAPYKPGDRWIDTAENNREFSLEDSPLEFDGGTLTFPGISGLHIGWVAVGDHLADNTVANQILIELPTQVALKATSAGNLIAERLPKIVTMKVSRGGVPVTIANDTTYSIVDAPGVVASIDTATGSSSKGNITISGMTANTGYIDVLVRYRNHELLPLRRLRVEREVEQGSPTSMPAPGGGGASINLTISSPVPGVTFGPVSPTVTADLSDSIDIEASLALFCNDSTIVGTTALVKLQYRAVGSPTWVDVAAAQESGVAKPGAGYSSGYEPGYSDPTEGHLALSQSISGLTAGSYEFQLVARLSAAASNAWLSGPGTITTS